MKSSFKSILGPLLIWGLIHVLFSSVAYCLEEEDTSLAVSTPLAVSFSSGTTTDNIEYSTTPVGSAFMRHLAFEMNEDIVLLNKMEKRGFGRAETITLIKIAQKSNKPLKELAKERLKDQPTLRSLSERATLNYDELYGQVQEIKKEIELKGDQNLPPALYELKEKDPDAEWKKKKKEKEDKKKLKAKMEKEKTAK